MTPAARDGFLTFMNYVGGSYMYIRSKYSERLKTLSSSWAHANAKPVEDEADPAEGEEEGGQEALRLLTWV